MDKGLGGLLDNLEGPVLHIGLDVLVVEATADEALGIKDGVRGVHGDLVFGCVSDEALSVCEGNIGGCGAVALVISDNFDAVVLPNGNARVSGSEVDTDSYLSIQGKQESWFGYHPW